VFASAIDWPGWCCGGKDDASALAALAGHAHRYAAVTALASVPFVPPVMRELTVVERLAGGSGTDFGAPEAIAAAEREPVDGSTLERLLSLFDACWAALGRAAEQAAGRELRKGPRGGGRELAGVLEHVTGAEAGYQSRLARVYRGPAEPAAVHGAAREAVLAAVRDGLPGRGPRGGAIWPVRYFIRRSAWHVLDHAWEIEDRVL
jgi:hypothetical protein